MVDYICEKHLNKKKPCVVESIIKDKIKEKKNCIAESYVCLLHLFFLYQTIFSGTCHFADIVFVVDSSGSIGAVNWRRLLQFVADVVKLFQIGGSNARVSNRYIYI